MKLQTFQDENIRFDSNGRMLYHPEFHPNHKKPYTESDLEYLCKFWDVDHKRTIAFALGRPERSLHSMVHILRKEGKFDYYKNLNKYW